LLMGSPWNEPRGEHLPKAWIVRSKRGSLRH
jgi:hypothetical protein